MKAIILAAGTGSRLMPLTKTCPKVLVSVQGHRVLDYQLNALAGAGVTDVVVVTGYQAQAFRGINATFHNNPHFESTNMVASLFCAESSMDTDLIVAYGDILFEPSALQGLIDSPEPFSVVVDRGWKELWQLRMENPLADAETLKINRTGNITELGKKPKTYRDIQGQYTGLFKIAKSILPEIRDFYHALDRDAKYEGRSFQQMFMTTFLQLLIDAGHKIHAVPITNGFLEMDTLEDHRLYETFGAKQKSIFDFDAFTWTSTTKKAANQ